MAQLVKCYGEKCLSHNIKHDKNIMKVISGKRYCSECYDKEIKRREQRDKLYNYIAYVYDIPFATPLMKKHVNEFIDNGLTYKKIFATIYYCVNIKKGFNMPDPKYGLIPFGNFYNEMVSYYKRQKDNIDKNKGKKNEKRTITIDDTHYTENVYKDSKIIDMEDL